VRDEITEQISSQLQNIRKLHIKFRILLRQKNDFIKKINKKFLLYFSIRINLLTHWSFCIYAFK